MTNCHCPGYHLALQRRAGCVSDLYDKRICEFGTDHSTLAIA